jgi:hypothetical protein
MRSAARPAHRQYGEDCAAESKTSSPILSEKRNDDDRPSDPALLNLASPMTPMTKHWARHRNGCLPLFCNGSRRGKVEQSNGTKSGVPIASTWNHPSGCIDANEPGTQG